MRATGAAASPPALNGTSISRVSRLFTSSSPEAAEPAHLADRQVALGQLSRRSPMYAPISAAFSRMPSSRNASIDATADAQASGCSAYVRPPGKNRPRTHSAIGSREIIAPSGT